MRLRERQAITGLPGFDEGAWWVQDAAAALPVRLLAPKPGERIADLCAAPGGKTAQLAALGAQVTAVDRSGPRLRRLRANLERLGLSAEIVTKDATLWEAEPFDAVLLDAPCSATGTIRRHPDVAWTKTPEDRDKLVALQARLLEAAARLTTAGRPAGLLHLLARTAGGRAADRSLSRRPSRFRPRNRSSRPRSAASTEAIDGTATCAPCRTSSATRRPASRDGADFTQAA